MEPIGNFSVSCFVLVFVFNSTLSKDLHFKEGSVQDNKKINSLVRMYETDNIFTKHERFARHLELQRRPDSIMSHLYKQMKGHTSILDRIVRKMKSKVKNINRHKANRFRKRTNKKSEKNSSKKYSSVANSNHVQNFTTNKY